MTDSPLTLVVDSEGEAIDAPETLTEARTRACREWLDTVDRARDRLTDAQLQACTDYVVLVGWYGRESVDAARRT